MLLAADAGGQVGPLPAVLRGGGHRARRPGAARVADPGAHARRGEEGRRRGRVRQGGVEQQKVGLTNHCRISSD